MAGSAATTADWAQTAHIGFGAQGHFHTANLNPTPLNADPRCVYVFDFGGMFLAPKGIKYYVLRYEACTAHSPCFGLGGHEQRKFRSMERRKVQGGFLALALDKQVR